MHKSICDTVKDIFILVKVHKLLMNLMNNILKITLNSITEL